jgi:hypothetical protein
MNYLKFKEGVKVEIAECYLNDEVTELFRKEMSSNATVCSEPKDDEQLVYIQYETGLIDIVPQDILTIIAN